MKYSYLSFGFLVGLVGACVLFSFFGPDASSGSDVLRLKVAHSQPVNHPIHAGIENFAERLALYSGGTMELTIFPNGQLGSETQTLEQMQTGSLALAKVGGATLGSFIPVAKVFSLPYLFDDSEHYWSVLNGPIGRDLLNELSAVLPGQASGFRGLTYYDAGSRNFYAKKPILSPADLTGLKIRVMNDPVAIDTMKALGASPTPIAWGELYTALQQGVVDGAENNPPSFVSSRHFEVCKEFSFDHHSRIPDVLMVSEKTWNALTEEQQGWMAQAAADSSEFQRQAWADGVEAALAKMEAEGVQVHEVDLAPFQKATESVRARYASDQLRGYLERIQAAK